MKKYLLGVLTGLIVVGTIAVMTAGTLIPATSVIYTKDGTSTTVNAALNDLFINVSSMSTSGQIKYGYIDSLVSTYKYEVELGFRPVYVGVYSCYGSAASCASNYSLDMYNEKVDNKIHDYGAQTNGTVGLPLTVSDAIYDNGFRLNQGYNYGGWKFYYVAFSEFPEE